MNRHILNKKNQFLLAATMSFMLAASAHGEDGLTDKKILLGQAVNISGPAPENNKQLVSGSKAYFDKINKSGGVHGRMIEVINDDDGYEPDRSFAVAQKMIEKEKVFLLFEFMGAPNSKAVLPLASKYQIPFLFPFTGADDLRQPVRADVFHVRASSADEAEALVHQAVDLMGKKNIGIFYQDDAFGSSGKAGVQRALANRKLTLTAAVAYKRNTVKIDEYLAELRKSNLDAVITWSTYKQGALLIKGAREAGLKWEFFGSSNLATAGFFKEGGAAVEGVRVCQVFPLPDDTTYAISRQYIQDYTAAGGSPDPSSQEGYINAVVLVEALKRAGRDLTREKLRKTIEAMKDVDIGGLKLSFSANNHQGMNRVFMSQVKNAQFVPVQ